MEQKIAQLTEAIYREGVERGEAQAKKIGDDAQREAEKIIIAAKTEAAAIIAAAKLQAEDIRKNTAAETKLAGRQAISAIKQQIVDLVMTSLIEIPLAKALGEPATIKEFTAAAIKSWGGEMDSAELILPEALRKEIEASFQSGLQQILKGGMTLTFTKNFKSGFQIKPQGSGFKISLTDDDFGTFFKEYLKPKTRTLLFGE
jgi:V/A-type H+-transporting ATPase subunit E